MQTSANRSSPSLVASISGTVPSELFFFRILTVCLGFRRRRIVSAQECEARLGKQRRDSTAERNAQRRSGDGFRDEETRVIRPRRHTALTDHSASGWRRPALPACLARGRGRGERCARPRAGWRPSRGVKFCLSSAYPQNPGVGSVGTLRIVCPSARPPSLRTSK
ncbi:hypothetical protein NN561_019905 [Cricetulus griseus]